VNISESLGLRVELIDRDIQTTLRRAWKKMKFREKFKIIYSMLGEEDEDVDIDLDEILENRDILSDLMNELKQFSPGAGEVLIDERDEFLAQKILQINPNKRTLAVVGAGHLSGIENNLTKVARTSRIEELSMVPERSAFSKSIPWLVPILVFGLFGFFLYRGSSVDIVELFTLWTLANAVLAAIGCIIARGHILAVMTAALASPITSLNPTLAAGWFAGYVQLKVAEPTAEDLQEFLKLESLGSFWSNKAGRVLLVTALTNLGSMLGAWIAAAGLIGGI
jgi:pheromone shutdown-related protein TraB